MRGRHSFGHGFDLQVHIFLDFNIQELTLTFDMTEGTDSTSTDTYDISTIPSHFHWWILRLS